MGPKRLHFDELKREVRQESTFVKIGQNSSMALMRQRSFTITILQLQTECDHALARRNLPPGLLLILIFFCLFSLECLRKKVFFVVVCFYGKFKIKNIIRTFKTLHLTMIF